MRTDLAFESCLQVLARQAQSADGQAVWPTESWRALLAGGGLRWCIPVEHGGDGLEGPALLERYEQLASACLTTCFILSQRDAACRRLRHSSNQILARRLLPKLAMGELFATVGLSQLTTSRQHLKPVLAAAPTAGGFHLEGSIPWVTGAARADYFIIGATLDDGRQILAVLPRQTPGISIAPPMELMALEGSLTTEVQCANVFLSGEWLLAGPVERVMAVGGGGSGGLETSCLALGLARAAIDYIHQEVENRSDLAQTAARLAQAGQDVRTQLHSLAAGSCSADEAAQVRARANELVLGATQSALSISKGAGFLKQHPAQRWARQALFFLVWSCPRPAADATLAYLAR